MNKFDIIGIAPGDSLVAREFFERQKRTRARIAAGPVAAAPAARGGWDEFIRSASKAAARRRGWEDFIRSTEINGGG